MKEALSIDSLRLSAQDSALKTELLPSKSTGSEESAAESFLEVLQKTIDTQKAVSQVTAGESSEAAPTAASDYEAAAAEIAAVESSEETLQKTLDTESPGTQRTRSDKEILASSVIAAAAMPKNLARFNEFLKDFAEKNPDKIGALNEIVGSLREALVTGVISLDQAVGKLKNAANDFLNILASLKNIDIRDLKSSLETSSQAEKSADLSEETKKLKDKFMENFKEMFEYSNFSGEVWISQVWPINQAASIFNGGGEKRVPYDSDRNSSDSGVSDKETREWDDKFESEWSGANKTVAVDPSKNFDSHSLNSLANFPAAVKPAVDSVPSGGLFEKMAKVIQLNLEDKNQRINLELNPDILGELKMKLSLDKDSLNARLLVENESIRSLLAGRMDELKDALALRGVTLGNVEIAVSETQKNDYSSTREPANRNFDLNSGSPFDFLRTPYSQSV